MGTAANLATVIAHGVDLDPLAVLVAEQTYRALGSGFGHGHFLTGDVYMRINSLLNQLFNLLELLRGDLPREAEVETQAFGGDVAALL